MEGNDGRPSRSRHTRYGTRGPGSQADRNAKTTGTVYLPATTGLPPSSPFVLKGQKPSLGLNSANEI